MPKALIAEDEPLLADTLAAELKAVWPDLEIVARAGDGLSAVEKSLALLPDVLFLDIRMPGLSGLDVAERVAERWPPDRASPEIVFVTAYDQYAVAAFDHAAVDYLLKPVDRARLELTVERLAERLAPAARAAAPPADLQRLLGDIRQVMGAATVPAPGLRVIRAAVGNAVRLIPIDEVFYFQSTDKYVSVVTADGEALLRTSLKELSEQLDPERFWQIHRSTIVNVDEVRAAVRDRLGRLSVQLKSRTELLPVSRQYADLFKQM
ncbi:MAG: LytTR family DNA-binding domain-containing protein [Betaproteobacteria bacterium]